MAHARRELGEPISGSLVGDQVVVLHRVPWAQYDALCRANEDSAGPRMAFLDGELEIMSPSRDHEADKTLMARLLEAYAEEMEISLDGYGSETFKKKAKKAGVEPDECYVVDGPKKLPDFAIEIEYSRFGIDKLEIYRRLGISEVWYWFDDALTVYRLGRRGFGPAARSAVLPDLDLAEIARLVRSSDGTKQTETVRAYRRRLRKR